MDQQPEKRKYVGPTVGPSPAPIETEDASSKRRRVIGPSLPPPAQASASASDETNNHDHKPSATISDSNSSNSDEGDDDDFGPTLPPPAGSAQPTQPAPSTTTTTSTTTSQKTEPKRDAWMLEPLEPSDRNTRIDPTRLKNRRFQSGPRAGNASASGGGGGIDVTWTETPDQKMKRLQDEVLGVQAPRNADAAGAGGVGGKQTQPSRAMQEKIQRYNEEKRREDAAAREKHKKSQKEEEDDPSKRAFDREKDMGLAGKITHAQRREMMSKAADFGSRFSSGKFL